MVTYNLYNKRFFPSFLVHIHKMNRQIRAEMTIQGIVAK